MDFEDDARQGWSLAIATLFALAASGGVFYFVFFGAAAPPQAPPQGEEAPVQAGRETIADESVPQTSAEVLENLTPSLLQATRPEELAAAVARFLEAGDLERAAQALGGPGAGVSPAALQRLQELGGGHFRLHQVREVGELEINRRKRFALEWEGAHEPLFLDLSKNEQGRWAVEKVRLAPREPGVAPPAGEKVLPRAPGADSLTISDRFLQATLAQEFATAKALVDTSKVSDAKIAALCILFEEGKYRLDENKPLRTLFNRDTTAGLLANVLTDDQPAQFGLSLERAENETSWTITEVNLDALLADYAQRVAGGDVYYTPLVANPQGGETLVIYFGFDEETLAPRTRRQLEIVAEVLRTDPDRRLTLSGHADALGSADYNRDLSRKRALSVKDFLLEQGVESSQIIIVAEGDTRPRRPNETATGEDNPEGRRANRRTEIYLDFTN
ncbi:OmpA family protein [Roseibacillus ishigakijimensis]|uniref:OmpA family protein n=1 Tax=Roseibacillus ishigakijimensis TaxID=454146 RepID=A0A934VIS1_9BACT|nr:OmpA family protein [Roseibacillus ishigakijimensis]MBK1835368.1 OmpA family protein [Roseibacillus ishigakijimensis]